MNDPMQERSQKVFDIIRSSPKKVAVLPYEESIGRKVREAYGLHPESVLGIVADRTGGIVIEDWIRLYGGGELDLAARNALLPFPDPAVGEDITGGLFLYLQNGNIGYFAPDTLEVEDLGIQYGRFLSWCLHGDTDLFYESCRWKGWQEEAAALRLEEGIAFYPFLWAQADGIESLKRSVVPIREIIGLETERFRR